MKIMLSTSGTFRASTRHLGKPAMLGRLAVPAVLAAGIACTPLAHAAGGKVAVNGKTIGPGTTVRCENNANPNNHPPNQIWITVDHAQVQVSSDAQQVIGVTIADYPYADGWMWAQNDQTQTGPATVAKTGNTYTITGKATPYSNLEYRSKPSGPPASFEIDATC